MDLVHKILAIVDFEKENLMTPFVDIFVNCYHTNIFFCNKEKQNLNFISSIPAESEQIKLYYIYLLILTMLYVT